MNQELIQSIVLIVIGFVVLFYGYKLNKLVISLSGFVFGYQLMQNFLLNFQLTPLLSILFSVLAGVCVGLLSFKVYLLGIFLTCFVLIFAICFLFIPDSTISLVSGIALGIVIGLLGVKFTKPIMIISTSFSGAFLIVRHVLSLFSINYFVLFVLISFLFAFGGIKVQFRLNQISE